MAQYQSFPDASGDSQTLEKLRALKLPDLAGRSFLDVGCNEGFFCGFAHHQGAVRVIGIDHSRLFIERARQRFAGVEFRCQGWEQLPEDTFDVILLASALHYADDQAALIERLIAHLSPDGMLVLELGIASSKDREWIKVERGIDEREFPSMPMLRHVLRDYAWKWMGPSVAQDGDPVARHVVHISRRLPVAYLLMQPPAYGKTSLATRLFGTAKVPVVSGDQLINRIAKGGIVASDALKRAIDEDFSPFKIDRAIQRIFDRGLTNDLVALCVQKSGGGDFALDMYVPDAHRAGVSASFAARRHVPVRLEWERPGPSLMPAAAFDEQVERFFQAMAADESADQASDSRTRPRSAAGGKGYVDEISLCDGRLRIRGWALDADARLPASLQVRIRSETTLVNILDKRSRVDVQRHLGLEHAMVGFQLSMPVASGFELSSLRNGFEVSLPGGASLQTSGSMASLLNASKAPAR